MYNSSTQNNVTTLLHMKCKSKSNILLSEFEINTEDNVDNHCHGNSTESYRS